MSDWRRMGRDSTSPAEDIANVDLSSTDYTPTNPARALRVVVGGVVIADTLEGTSRTLNFIDGETRAVYVKKIYKTGTTCTGIEAHF